jgi:selenocysteine-specific elongation factor
MRHIILGTAGHIDHGKSALVKALTGIDPDRLKEEKERGITIDIGFADLSFPDAGVTRGIVDVPGHEKLIRNMLAGAGGIDMVLLVIAADEGIMPQSREHLAICDMLKIKTGLIALTKADLVEKEWLQLVRDEVRTFIKDTFLDGAPIVPVSSRTGENLELLKKEIRDIALSISPKTAGGLFRLPIDRVFTLKGFGTVITGTAISGRVSVEDQVEILPSNVRTKVRGLHSHGKAISAAFAGQRVAINLQGVEKDDLRRGDVAVVPGRFRPTKIIDAFLELLDGVPVLKSKSLIHFYSGTSETIARVILYEKDELNAGESCYCQLRLKDPVVAMSGDRYIIRRFSPLETLGGGKILDPAPVRRRRKDGINDLRVLDAGSLDERLSLKIEKGASGITVHSLEGWINTEPKTIAESLDRLLKVGTVLRYEDILLHRQAALRIHGKIMELLKSFHKKNPLKAGMPKEEVRTVLKIDPKLFNFVLAGFRDVIAEKDILRIRDFKIALSSSEEESRAKIQELLEKGGVQPPAKEELARFLKMDQKRITDILGLMSKEGLVVRINDSVYLSAGAYDRMLSLLREFFSGKGEMTVAEFRDLLNTSRKYALPLLEYLDARKITIRTGDVRKMMKGSGV